MSTSTLDRIPVTRDDLAVIRTRTDTGYHGVYATRKPGQMPYRAKPFRKRGGGGYFPTPLEAAKYVVRWWKRAYGDDWREVFQHRKEQPWMVRKSEANGYYVVVWLEGEKTYLNGGQDGYFPTRIDAERFLRRWIRRELGLFAPVVLHRGRVQTGYLRPRFPRSRA